MKNYEEIANSVFERREQYEIVKNKKRKFLTHTIIPVCCVCLVALFGFSAWKVGLFEKQPIKTADDAVVEGTKDWYGPDEVESSNSDIAMEIQSNATENNNENTSPTVVLQRGNVDIFYVIENKIHFEQKLLPLSPQEIFKAWKEKNNIGDDVKFIEVVIEDNSTTTSEEFNGSTVMTHKMGDYFIYNLTISKEIENYYTKISSELLLKSLENTMTSYSTINFDGYNLILK